jgi:hypothetical protein
MRFIDPQGERNKLVTVQLVFEGAFRMGPNNPHRSVDKRDRGLVRLFFYNDKNVQGGVELILPEAQDLHRTLGICIDEILEVEDEQGSEGASQSTEGAV